MSARLASLLGTLGSPLDRFGPATGGHALCFDDLRLAYRLAPAGDRDGYTIVRIDTRRLRRTASTYAHLARDPASGAPRVIGVWRP